MTPDLRPYVVLLTALLTKRLEPKEFQAVFVALFKSDQLWRPHEVYEVLNEAFLAAEAFDPVEGATPYAVGQEELLAIAANALERLETAVDPE